MRKYILLITDVIMIIGVFIIALLIRFHGVIDVVEHQNVTISFLLIFIPILFYFYDLYKPQYYTQRLRAFYRLVKVWLISLLVYVVLGFLTKFAFLIESRIFIITFFILWLCLLFFVRLILIKYLLECCTKWNNGDSTCDYIGPHDMYDEFKHFFDANQVAGIKLSNSRDSSLPRRNKEAFLCSTSTTFADFYEDIKTHLNGGEKLHVTSPLLHHIDLGWEWCTVNGLPVYTFEQRKDHKVRDALRRVIDIVGSIAGLIILAPLFVLVSIAIKLDSPGGVIYKQIRCGKNGKKFVFFKFRSMREHGKTDTQFASESNHYMSTAVSKTQIVENDYITDIGRIIRKTSIDEWPQFLNVLKGDMSLIGPRPHRPHELKCYQDWHKDRLLVNQGLTGLWQVYGRGEMPCDKSIFLDLIYVATRSITLDIKLLFKTIPAVVLGKGAY